MKAGEGFDQEIRKASSPGGISRVPAVGRGYRLRATDRIGTLPRVGTPDRLHGGTRKVRANPWLAVAIAAGVLLFAAWIAWVIHVTSDNGASPQKRTTQAARRRTGQK